MDNLHALRLVPATILFCLFCYPEQRAFLSRTFAQVAERRVFTLHQRQRAIILEDFAVIQYQDLVAVCHRSQPVSDGNHGNSIQAFPQDPLDSFVGGVI